MATTKNEFAILVDELFEEFADFIKEGTFNRILSTNQKTGEINEDEILADIQQKVNGIQTKYNEKIFGANSQSQNTLRMVGDYTQVYKWKDFTWIPEIGNCSITFGGIKSQIIDVKLYPDIAIFFHLRRM